MAIKSVLDENDLMIITQKGLTIRLPISALRVMGRAAQGVRLINLKGEDKIASIARVTFENTSDEELSDEIITGDEPTGPEDES